jgi:hypothetical protein
MKLKINGLWTIGLAMAIHTAPIHADESSLPEAENEGLSFFKADDSYAYKGDIWRPALSLYLPGFDQYVVGQYGWGFGYSAATIGGYVWNEDAKSRARSFKESSPYKAASDAQRENYSKLEGVFREQRITQRVYDVSGALSAYHSFRTAVHSRQAYGEYAFMKGSAEEKPQDILLAPFDFSYVARPSTWIPLAVITGLYVASNSNMPNEYESRAVDSGDIRYSLGQSYMAGTAEEPLFRGYLQPLLREYTGSNIWTNGLQATAFTLAHPPGRGSPVFHFSMGLYFGWLTQRNHWSIRESIFLHTWVDVIAFIGASMIRKKDPVIILPPLEIVF